MFQMIDQTWQINVIGKWLGKALAEVASQRYLDNKQEKASLLRTKESPRGRLAGSYKRM